MISINNGAYRSAAQINALEETGSLLVTVLLGTIHASDITGKGKTLCVCRRARDRAQPTRPEVLSPCIRPLAQGPNVQPGEELTLWGTILHARTALESE